MDYLESRSAIYLRAKRSLIVSNETKIRQEFGSFSGAL